MGPNVMTRRGGGGAAGLALGDEVERLYGFTPGVVEAGALEAASFPWLPLERPALHHAAAAARSHARRGPDLVAPAAPETARPDDATVRRLERIFARIRRHPEDPGTSVAELAPEVEQVLARRAPLPGDVAAPAGDLPP